MKTSEANIEDLKGMVVSDGTMRPKDLIPKFLNVLKVYGRDVYDKYVGENPEVLDLTDMDDETMGWVVDELFDKLNEIAPEGYSFESQDGDGACYGFWSGTDESLDHHIDVKGRGVVELCEDDYLKLSRDIKSRGYCKDKDGAYNVWIGGSFKGTFPSVEAAADAGYTLVEGKRCEAQVSENTFKQGVDEFIGAAPEGGWSDYWAMQQDWEFYKDSLCRDGVITQKQADSWSNPCTPDTFDRWQKRNGLVHRGYESKKSDGKNDKGCKGKGCGGSDEKCGAKKSEGKEYNVYVGYYELLITDKVLDTPYELIDSRPLYDNIEDDLLVDYPSATIVYDQDIKDEVIANVYPWLAGESDISGVQFADFSEDTVKTESRKNEAYSDYDAIRDWLEGVMEKAGTMFKSASVSDNRPGEICAEIEGYDSTGGDAIISLVWNAGEDFAETISAMADELVEYAEDFDPEEEAETYSNSGMAGVPSLRQLLKAMDERKEDMVSLAGAVSLEASKL